MAGQNEFSSLYRYETLAEMENQTFDLLVIGGGITGCGIALDATTRGLNTALIEMQDFAAGTSSRSTKLVHGGLRYLKQLQIHVVSEVGKERAIVYENGPHVTTPEWMLLPIYKGGTFGKFSTSIGLKVYDFLAAVKKNERRTMLSEAETLRKEPLLKKKDLIGSGYYVEYRTDDARLTIEVIKEAVKNGAKAVNYAKAETFLYENGRLVGVEIKDQIKGSTYVVRAKHIVNATGPWVDTLRELDKSKNGKKLRLTKGVHLVIDQSVFPLKQAVYFDTPDGRMVFAIPRDGKTYVGTTDTFYDQDPINPKMTTEDREYLLNAIHFMFPDIHVTEKDCESSWAGVRPLIYEEGKDPSEISRKDEIWRSNSGLITIAGGKLTGYRKMAETVVDLVTSLIEHEENRKFKPCSTKTHPISGGHVGGSENWPIFFQEKVKEACFYGFTEEQAKRLVQLYGSDIQEIFDLVATTKNEFEQTNFPLDLYVQIRYGIEREMVVKPVDFFIRRTGALFFDINWVQKWKSPVIRYMCERFKWSQAEEDQYRDELESSLRDSVVPSV